MYGTHDKTIEKTIEKCLQTIKDNIYDYWLHINFMPVEEGQYK